MNHHEPTNIRELPRILRIARRGRSFDEVAEEAKIGASTLRRAEKGEDINLHTLMAIIEWTREPIVIHPQTAGHTPEEEPNGES